MALTLDTISAVGASTKYKYTNGFIIYIDNLKRIEVTGDKIYINNKSFNQTNIEFFFGSLSDKYGTSTAEEYVEYLITNNIF